MAQAASTISGTSSVADLPVPLTPFVGRTRELDDLLPLLGQSRLVTLTGAGGSGKTRLALEAVQRAAAGLPSMTWVDLAPVSDGNEAVEHIALRLRAKERGGTAARDAIVLALRDTSTLLVLDNCEHVVDAVAALVDEILRGCPAARVLATSREALGVPGETAWLVPPLAAEEAAALFLDRARAANPTFKPADSRAVDTICRRLDGIPLAIELAAARTRVLPVEQIAERLDDAFRLLASGSRTALPRHRTLRGTMDWSYELLSSRERIVLRRVAVFSGPFSLEAAEAVCGGDLLAAEDVLDGVAALVDKSLVVMAPDDDIATYRLLETVRQYARERLEEAGEGDVVRLSHAEYYVRFAEDAEPHLFGGAGEPEWLARVTSASGNLRAASVWCEQHPDRATIALRINVAINWYWFATGQLGEACQRLNTALAHGVADDQLRGRAHLALAHLALWQGDHATLGPQVDRCLEALGGRADEITQSSALALKCASLVLAGDPVGAAPYALQAVAIARACPPHVILPFALYWTGWAAIARGDHTLAREALEEATAVGRRIRHRPSIAHPLALLGRLALEREDYDEAFHRFAEGLEIHSEIGDLFGIAIEFEGMAPVCQRRGHPRRAARLLGAADAVRDRMSARLSPIEMAQRERLLLELERDLAGSLEALIAEGRALSLAEAVQLALRADAMHTGTFRVTRPEEVEPVGNVDARDAGLRVEVLGPFQVHVGTRSIESTVWGSARPRELLVILLMHPEGCTKEQIGLAFWPEASTTQVRNNFHVTLHRLRKALRHPEWITTAQERYRVDPSIVAEFDVASFERAARDALAAFARGDPGALEDLERASALYRGDFMDGEPAGDWHLPHRDRLQRLFIETMMALGELHTRQQRPTKAVTAYRRILARDELHEDAVRALMASLDEVGERVAARRLFERFSDRLRQELQARPSRETVALYQRLADQGVVV